MRWTSGVLTAVLGLSLATTTAAPASEVSEMTRACHNVGELTATMTRAGDRGVSRTARVYFPSL